MFYVLYLFYHNNENLSIVYYRKIKKGDFIVNYLWPVLIILSMLCGACRGCLNETVEAGLNAAKNSVDILFSFAGMICFWSGFLKIADSGNILVRFEKLLHPVLTKLFPKLEKGSKAMKQIAANIAANMLGVGNAATPAGIEAMSELDKINPHPETPTDEMCIFTILNTSSLQIIPTTVISLRAAAGSAKPTSIIPAVWICSFISLSAALCSIKIILYRQQKRKKL